LFDTKLFIFNDIVQISWPSGAPQGVPLTI